MSEESFVLKERDLLHLFALLYVKSYYGPRE